MTLHPSFLDRPIAHRGLHDAEKGNLENSASAFLAAIEHGFGIELDVQLSGDHAAMVFHDYDLSRLTDQTGPIQARPQAELAQIGLVGGSDHINTLPEILDLIAGRVPVLIELKDQDGAMGDNLGPLEAAVAQALHQYDGAAAVMSFNPNSVVLLQELCPDIARGLVTSSYDPKDWPFGADICDRLRDIPDYARSGASFISHEAADLGRARVAALKAGGANVLCWTIRSEQQAEAALKIADNITFEGYLPA